MSGNINEYLKHISRRQPFELKEYLAYGPRTNTKLGAKENKYLFWFRLERDEIPVGLNMFQTLGKNLYFPLLCNVTD